jgi:cytochrome P450
MANDPRPAPPGFLSLLGLQSDYAANPEAVLAPLRNSCPVHADPVTGHVLVSTHATARALLNDPTLMRHPSRARSDTLYARFTERRPPDPDVPPGERSSILMLDPPDHRRIRGPLQRAFHARVHRSRGLVETVIDSALGDLAGTTRFDLVEALAIPIPIHAIAAILGVAPERRADFRRWSEDIILTLNPFRSDEEDARALAAVQALHDYFAELMAARRREPQDDLVSDLVALQAEGAELSDKEVQINLTALLVGGNLTTTDLMSSGVRLLLDNPGEAARLVADPSLAASAVEEVLRMEGPVDFTPRVACEARSIEGVAVTPGTPVFALLRAANRDPAAFPDPDRFDIGRDGQAHLSFGGGSHICIGAALARLEARLFLPRFLAAFPKARRADAPLRYRSLPGFRGLAELWIEAD